MGETEFKASPDVPAWSTHLKGGTPIGMPGLVTIKLNQESSEAEGCLTYVLGIKNGP